jgi:hypothetical protein
MVKVVADVVKSFRCSAGQSTKCMHVQNSGDLGEATISTCSKIIVR